MCYSVSLPDLNHLPTSCHHAAAGRHNPTNRHSCTSVPLRGTAGACARCTARVPMLVTGGRDDHRP